MKLGIKRIKTFGYATCAVALSITFVALTGAQGTEVARVDVPGSFPPNVLNAANSVYGWRGDFGITPGSGTFLQADKLQPILADLKSLNVRFIRSTITWQNFQPDAPMPGQPPKYNWKGVDGFVQTLNSPQFKGQFRIIVTLSNAPDWAIKDMNVQDPTQPTGTYCRDKAKFDVHAFANAAGALAAHLNGMKLAGETVVPPVTDIRTFEVQNSPNSPQDPGDWAPYVNPCGYTELLRETYSKIHGTTQHPVRPDANVLVGGVGGTKTEIEPDANHPDCSSTDMTKDNRWSMNRNYCKFIHLPGDQFVQALYDYGAKGFFDGIAFHSYSSPDLPCAPDPSVPCKLIPPTGNARADRALEPYGPNNGWDRMLNTRQIMVNHNDTVNKDGSTKRVWVTEYGSATGEPPAESGMGGTPVYPEGQAKIIAWAYYRASQLDWLGPLCIYTYKDGNRDGHGGDFMGLKNEDPNHPITGTPKYAYRTYNQLAHNVHTLPQGNNNDVDAADFGSN